MSRLVSLRSVVACAVIGGFGLFASVAQAADMPLKAPAAGCAKAVDGVNGKLAGFGGSFSNDSVYGVMGSLSMPLDWLGCHFGSQTDVSGASLDGDFLGVYASHLFWRDPNKGLIGLYGSQSYWDRVGGVRVGHEGVEGEIYSGQWTLQGVAGVEWGNSRSGFVGSTFTTYDIQTRFFDQVNVVYYPTENLKLSAGHRYVLGKNALALGAEYGIPAGHGVMASLFAEGRVGEDDYQGVWGGVRIYFGQKDKSLIRRHREDDPTEWGGGIDGAGSTASGALCDCK